MTALLGAVLGTVPVSPAFGQACLDPLDRAAPFCPVAERVFDISTNGMVIAVADVNADGAVDVLTLHGPYEGAWLPTYLLVHRNLCAGDFFETPGAADTYDFNTSGGPPLSADMVVADLLGDPLPDVACIVGYPFRDHRLIILENRDAGSFAPPHVDLSLGTSDSMSGALDLAAADLDNDGDLDLVIVDSHSDGPRIWIAWNDNGFSQNSLAEHVFTGDGTPNRVAVADLDPHVTDCNTNGGPDLLIAAFEGEESPALYVFLNRGCTAGGDHATRFDFVNDDGTFTILAAAEALAAGHFNRDDHASQQQFPDVAWLSPNADRVYVFLNQWAVDAQEVFAGSSVDAVPTFATGMAVCDLDADGLDDVLVSSKQDFLLPEHQDFLRGAGTLTVLHNVTEADVEDEAEFERIDYPLTYKGVAVTCGDISRDGCLDAAVLARTFYPFDPPRGSMSFLHGRRDGTLRVQTDYGIFRKVVVDIDCGDFNADERMDIAVTNLHEIKLAVLTQQEDGTFEITFQAGDADSSPPSPPTWADSGVAAAVANFNGLDEDDLARDDIAVVFDVVQGTADEAINVRVLHADIPEGTADVGFIVASELYLDGSVDLSDIQAGDVDGINGPDLVITDRRGDGTIHVLLNRGDGTFDASTNYASYVLPEDNTGFRNDEPVSLVLVDLDLDGDLDVVTANEAANTVSIMLNNGSGVFQASSQGFVEVGVAPRAVAAGMIDLDDLPDIVTANTEDETVSVLINDFTSPGTLLTRIDFLVGQGPVDVCLRDLNGDCLDDIVVLEQDSKTLSILLNDGTGNFDPERRIILQANNFPTALACCDLDANNNPDLISSWNHDLGAIRLTYNECILTDSCALPGDMNNDGLLDGDDIQPFVDCLYVGILPFGGCACADFNQDRVLDFTDVACFVQSLLAGEPLCAPQDCPSSPAQDCNSNGVYDAVEIHFGTATDCNRNFVPDECDIASGSSADANQNGIPDECEGDCNGNGLPDDVDIAGSTSNDVNSNAVPDECEPDCNSNGTPDSYDIAVLASLDCNSNGRPDECELDCNTNGTPDFCDVRDHASSDCNTNFLPDECDLILPFIPSIDCDTNGTLDECDLAVGTAWDCNTNDTLDLCDIALEQSEDADTNGIPDECEEIEQMQYGESQQSEPCDSLPPTDRFEQLRHWLLERDVQSLDRWQRHALFSKRGHQLGLW